MAILAGFPPSNTIAPTVRIAEKDLSFIAPEQSAHTAGLVGFASKGPMNIPTRILTSRQLHNTFGYPHPESGDPYLLYAAEAYLQVANQLYVVRVGQEENVNFEQATTASVDVPSAGGQIRVVSNVAGPYVFANDSFLRWRVNGVLSVKTLVVFAGTYTADQLADVLNDQLDAANGDGIEFYVATGGFISIRTTFAYGPESELELVSVQDSMYGGTTVGGGGTNVTGWGQAMAPAQVTGTADRYPFAYSSPGVFDFSGLTDLNLLVVIDGTDNVLIDNIVQAIDLSALEGGSWTAAQVATAINDQKIENGGDLPGGWTAIVVGGTNIALVTDHFGRDARIRVKADSTASALFGLNDFTYSGVSPVGTSGTPQVQTYGRINGDSNTTGEITFTIEADSAGMDGNATQVVISNNVQDGTFNVAIYNNEVQVEAWGSLTKDETSRYFVETYIATVSSWIRVIDREGNLAPPLDGTYNLFGGSDGIPADPDDQDRLLIGNEIGSTGLYAMSESDQIDIDLVALPGHSSTAVVLAMLDFCQVKRQDCMAIIDPPFGLTPNEIAAWQNGTHPLNSTRFDSDFGALYWPWVKIRDTFNQVDVWAPPSGNIMAMIARSDQLFAPWFAPAGTTRGIVPGITDVFSRPTSTERDLMQGNRNCVNPIIQFVNQDGFVAFGQKTLQRRPTALDRVGVRRMMFTIEKRIKAASRDLQFEPHDEELRGRFVRIASAILEEVKIGRGLTEYQVQCDEELNPSDVVDRNELRARIGVIPTRAAEYIYIEFSIHRTGGFAEASDTF